MPRLLLDSHAFLWFVNDDPRLSTKARSAIEDPNSTVFYSLVSIWELSIKVSLGRLVLRPSTVEFFQIQAANNDFALLPIEVRHLAPISTLPFQHRDPFDRLLVSQAIVEGIPLLSADLKLDAYKGLVRLW